MRAVGRGVVGKSGRRSERERLDRGRRSLARVEVLVEAVKAEQEALGRGLELGGRGQVLGRSREREGDGTGADRGRCARQAARGDAGRGDRCATGWARADEAEAPRPDVTTGVERHGLAGFGDEAFIGDRAAQKAAERRVRAASPVGRSRGCRRGRASRAGRRRPGGDRRSGSLMFMVFSGARGAAISEGAYVDTGGCETVAWFGMGTVSSSRKRKSAATVARKRRAASS